VTGSGIAPACVEKPVPLALLGGSER
jgi:hypothetical protein